jgi:hypothetical protein
VWVAGPWGAVLLVQTLTGSDDEDDDAEDRPHRLGG